MRSARPGARRPSLESRGRVLNALALHIERSGSGAPLVLWHGWGLNLRVFDSLRGALGATGVSWRTEAVDLPGHGLSPWREEGSDAVLARLVGSLPAGSTLLGWSLGGQFALRAALAAPERVARLVLVGATPRFTSAPGWPQGQPPESLSLMQSRLAEDYRRTVGEFLELQVRGSRDAAQAGAALRAALLRHGEAEPEALAQMQARLAEDYRRTVGEFLELQVRGSRDAAQAGAALRAALLRHGEAEPEALAAGLDWLARHDLRDSLARVRQPALVIAGQHDRVTPPAASEALAAALPRARYLQVARAAHAPFLSHPLEFLTALLGFLADAEAA